MSGRVYKGLLVLVAGGLLVAAGHVQEALNRQRADPQLGLTRVAPLENAPPVLAFTTVALGGFRGLIANALWLRASDLQEQGKYFEMVQLADWITKLQPHFVQVWIVQAWNMAYNISVKFSDPADRWRWVQKGIELLRDQALRYNPNEALLYRELAWFFQHKMGYNLDDAHLFYKRAWAVEMTEVLGPYRTNLAALVAGQTEEARRIANQLRQRYKLDPAVMLEVDQAYGPLEWRLPEAHALYWAWLGLQRSTSKDKRFLRRVVYQSMKQCVEHGRIITLGTNAVPVEFGPDVDKIEKANLAFEQMIAEEKETVDSFKRAHRNFLGTAVYLLWINNRPSQAEAWFRYLKQQYPGEVPAEMTVDEFAIQTYVGDVSEMRQDRARAIIEGLLGRYCLDLALGEEDAAVGHHLLARRIWESYQAARQRQKGRLGLAPFETIRDNVIQRYLDPQTGLRPELAARLRAALNLAPAQPR
jgi:hypothetical protein